MEDGELQRRVKGIVDRTDPAPYLFVGTGMAKRYVDSPSWGTLLQWCASLTDYSYQYYEQRARRAAGGGSENIFPRIGSFIDQEFNDVWWNDDRYKEERQQRQESESVPESPLKLQIAKKLRKISDRPFPEQHASELAVLKDATIDGIITTNYDTVLERRLFSDYASYAGQDAIIFSEQYSIAEIYKIHGSIEDPDSLVLTGADYQRFERRNHYLAAKLITIFLEHPVVFLGYSIRDPDIQTILASVIECLDPDRLKTLGERLVFVEYEPSLDTPEIGLLSKQVAGRDLRLTRIRAANYTPVFRALAERRRHLSAKLMRQVKEEMYDLVRSSDPDEELHVVDIEDLDDHDEVEIVVGVGVYDELARRGLKGIEIDELFEDLVREGTKFNESADEVVRITIHNWLNERRVFTPLFKYLSHGGLLDESGNPLEEELQPRIVELTNLRRDRFEYDVSENTKEECRQLGVDDIVERFGDSAVGVCRYLSLVGEPNLESLREFLELNLDLLEGRSGRGPFKKLCCIYDRLEYGPGFE